MGDGSKHIPIAITTRTVESQKKIVKILAGITEVQIIPVAGSMKVLVNGQPITLPAALKEEFIRESTRCPREIIIPTPVSELYERISLLVKPTGMMHIVEKQPTKLCISKQMVKTCLTKPLSIKQRSVEFACVPAPSVLAR